MEPNQTENADSSLTAIDTDGNQVPVDHTSSKGVFGWCEINGISLPTILRQENSFLSVRMVELKLMGHIRQEIAKLRLDNPVVSHYVTANEAKLLNEINFKHCDREYGKESFSSKDLIVEREQFAKFYQFLLEKIKETTGKDVSPAAAAAAVAAATAAKQTAVAAANAANQAALDESLQKKNYAKKQKEWKRQQQIRALRQQQLHLHMQQQQLQKQKLKPLAPKQTSGWIQLNNTMVPYLLRTGIADKFIPMDIVVGAAQLLGHVVDKKPIAQPAYPFEINTLNAACQREKIDFTFAMPTFLIGLSTVENLTRSVGGTLEVTERPAINPFGHARHHLPAVGPENVQVGNNPQAQSQPVIIRRPNVVPQKSREASQQQFIAHKFPMLHQTQMPQSNHDVVTTASIRQSLSDALHGQSPKLAVGVRGTVAATNPFGTPPRNSQQAYPIGQSIAPRPPQNPFGPLISVKFVKIANKDILFVISPTFPEGAALVGDVCRQLFPRTDMDELLYAMTSVLHIPLSDCPLEMELAFRANLPPLDPRASLKLIRQSVLDEYYLRLSYMFPGGDAVPPKVIVQKTQQQQQQQDSQQNHSQQGQPQEVHHNLHKQPTMTLKQIAQQLNAHAASAGVVPGQSGVVTSARGSASVVLKQHLDLQLSTRTDRLPHVSPSLAPGIHAASTSWDQSSPASNHQSIHVKPTDHPTKLQQPPTSQHNWQPHQHSASIEHPAPAAKVRSDPIILSDSEDEEPEVPAIMVNPPKAATTAPEVSGVAPTASVDNDGSASNSLVMSDTDNGLETWKDSQDDEDAVNFVLAENPEVVQDDVLKLAFALSPPPPPTSLTPPASEADFPSPAVKKKMKPLSKKRKLEKLQKMKDNLSGTLDADEEFAKLVKLEEEVMTFGEALENSSSGSSSDEWSPSTATRRKKMTARIEEDGDETERSEAGKDGPLIKRWRQNQETRDVVGKEDEANVSDDSSESSWDLGDEDLNLLDARDRERLSSTGSSARPSSPGLRHQTLQANRSSVLFGPNHWSVLASVDARLEERRKLKELYDKYKTVFRLKRCEIRVRRVCASIGEKKKRVRKKKNHGDKQKQNSGTRAKSKDKFILFQESISGSGDTRTKLTILKDS